MAGQKVKVSYFGLVQNAVGLREEELQLPAGSSIRGMLEALGERHGNTFRYGVLTSDGKLRPTTRVLLNGRDVEELGGLDTRLKGSAEVSITVVVYPVEGG